MSRLRTSENDLYRLISKTPNGSFMDNGQVMNSDRLTPTTEAANMGGSVVIDLSKKEESPVDFVQKPPEDVKLLCFNIAELTKTTQFVTLTVAIFFFYIIYGYIQELIFKLEGFQPFGWYLTLVQFACYTVFGTLELQMKADKTRRIPLRMYMLLAFLTVSTMGFSNSSVGYLNYPTQVIFKCCKLIPVLIGGVLIQGKRYGFIDVAACGLMSIGLILFVLADSSLSPNFNSYGVMLVSLGLCADAVIGNYQEKTMKQHGATNSEMVLYSYSIGFVYLLVGQIITGQILPAFSFFLQNPMKTYGYAVIFSFTGYLGVSLVLTMVKTFGALIAVTVTTCRKAVTIILSFLFFTKPFTSQYVWSGVIVMLGIYLNVYSKNRASWDRKFTDLYRLARRKLYHTDTHRFQPPERIV